MGICRETNSNDETLINQVAEGSEPAFEELLKKYEQAVFSTIYRYTGYKEDVKDLAQEIFIKVWRKAKDFKGKARFSTWLFRIVVNHCLNYRTKHKQSRHQISLEEFTNEKKLPGSLIVHNDCDSNNKAEIIRQAIRDLPDHQRIALVLTQFEEKSHQEVAEIMEISVSAVHSLIFRARCTLKKKLKKVL